MKGEDRMSMIWSKKIRKLMLMFGIFVMIIAGAVYFLSMESLKDSNLSISTVDFNNLNDGAYIGEYKYGRYEVQVTVSSGKVTDIEVLNNTAGQQSEFTGKLFNKVINTQSLEVDIISGATTESKAYLKAVDNALVKAQNK